MLRLVERWPELGTTVETCSSIQERTTVPRTAGQLTLREAVEIGAPGAFILFDPSLSGETIVLAATIEIPHSMTIQGNVPITISGDNKVRVFNVAGGSVNLENLTIMEGRHNQGGGLAVAEGATAILTHSTVKDNSAPQGTIAGIYNQGTLTILHSTISNNIMENIYISGFKWFVK